MPPSPPGDAPPHTHTDTHRAGKGKKRRTGIKMDRSARGGSVAAERAVAPADKTANTAAAPADGLALFI